MQEQCTHENQDPFISKGEEYKGEYNLRYVNERYKCARCRHIYKVVPVRLDPSVKHVMFPGVIVP